MSQLPEVTITVLDGGLGVIPNTAGNVEVTVGVSSGATPGTLYAFGDLQTLEQTIGYGPGAEATALKLALGGAGNPQLYISPTPNYDGCATAVTHTGTGFGVLTTGFGPAQQITIRVQTVGTLGTMKFTWQVGTGPISTPVATTATPFGPFLVPGTMTNLTFADGGGAWVAGEVATIAATGVVAISTNTNSNTLTQSSQPFDTYPVTVTPSTSGGYSCAPGPTTTGIVTQTGFFQYGLDLNPVTGAVYSASAPTRLPASGKFAIPNSGVVLKFAQQTLIVKITTNGTLGTMAYDTNLGGAGFTGSPITTTATTSFTSPVAGSNYVLFFAAHNYPIDITYSWDAQGNFTGANAFGAADNLVSLTSTEFPVGDVYSFQTLASGYALSGIGSLEATLQALLLLPNKYSFIHVVGTTSAAADAEALAAGVDAQLVVAASNFKFVRCQTECPTLGTITLTPGMVPAAPPIADTTDTDTVLENAFQPLAVLRTGVGAGDAIMTNVISGLFLRRNAAWIACARVAQVVVSEDLAYVGRGALPFVSFLFRDEAKTPALDAARFTTLRTFQGENGYYITNGRLMASPTSDFSLIQYGRVMDVACQLARAGLLPFLSGKVRVNTVTGFINEKDARAIEAEVTSDLNTGLVAPGDASAAFVTLSRTTNLLSLGAEPVQVRIVSLAYLKELICTLAFFSPAISG